jgi:hypothetical protein
MVMYLVASVDLTTQRWRWNVLDADGKEIEVSAADYGSIAEALEAGRERYQTIARKHTPALLRRSPRRDTKRGAA